MAADTRVILRGSASPGRASTMAVQRAAVRDIVPMLVGVLPFAVVIGVAMADLRIGLASGLAASFLLYGGSVQVAALALVVDGSGVLVAVLTAAIVNARMLLYGASMSARFRDQPGWFRWIGPHFIVDQTAAISAGRNDLDEPARFRRYWLSAAAVLTIGWLSGIAVGMALGPVMPASSPLDVATPALFVALVARRLSDPVTAGTAIVATVVAVAASGLPNGAGLLVSIAAGVTVAVVVTRHTGRSRRR